MSPYMWGFTFLDIDITVKGVVDKCQEPKTFSRRRCGEEKLGNRVFPSWGSGGEAPRVLLIN